MCRSRSCVRLVSKLQSCERLVQSRSFVYLKPTSKIYYFYIVGQNIVECTRHASCSYIIKSCLSLPTCNNKSDLGLTARQEKMHAAENNFFPLLLLFRRFVFRQCPNTHAHTHVLLRTTGRWTSTRSPRPTPPGQWECVP